MHPRLFEIPFIHWPVPTYGVMMVMGFLSAVYIIRRLSRDITPDPQMVTNGALYSLIAGVFGSRLFYVLHHLEQFRGRPLSFFAVWQGGLELLGGVILAITVILLFLRYHRLPVRRYLDILAIGLMAALAFGRIGCFLNGCCFGRPTSVAWAVRFPYGSDPYYSQVNPNTKRDRPQAYLQLPPEYFEVYEGLEYLKPYERLSEEQKQAVTEGEYRCLPVHPTQLYSSANAFLCCVLLYFFWRRSLKAEKSKGARKVLSKPGSTFALMFIIYGIVRFLLEMVRDDNPFEYGWWIVYKGGTVSQNLGIYLVVLGVVLMAVFEKMQPGPAAVKRKK
ncbi:MAG TPA: prolipoprotein diacylglyceryl transferase [Sedimentisphaerales bacterium]|nr:prolipoprotein diacylglyceryl transferase [Sedimentisphaerales bacterium]